MAVSVCTQHVEVPWAQRLIYCDGSSSTDVWQSGGASLTRTKLLAGLFGSPKMSRVATPPLMAAASLCDFE